MNKYQKLPVQIEAFQWTGDIDQTGDPVWLIDAIRDGVVAYTIETHTLTVHTLEGVMIVNRDDYVIQGVKGEIYPCKPDIFEATYRPVPETFEARLQIEHDELLEKVQKLRAFADQGYPQADPAQKDLLAQQLNHMTAYLHILNERLSALSIAS